MKILYALLSVFIVTNWALIVQGTVMRIASRVGRRVGVRIYQPYIDILKNYAMRSSITHGIMFYLGPVFRLSGGIGLYLFMPVIFGSDMFSNFSFAGDVALVMYFVFFGTLGMALGAGESGHPYAAIGVTRGLSQTTVAELPFALAVLAIIITNHTMSITGIVAAQQGGISHWTLITNPVATAAALLSMLGTFMRPPFDVVLAPQEVPIGPPTEYHSSFLAMMQTNRALFPMAKIILIMNLFFGGATSWPELMIKSFAIYMWPVFVGAVFPRFRVDQSVVWFLKIPLLLGILAILLV